MPRMRAVVTFSEVVDVTVKPGVKDWRFLMSLTPPSLSSCADRAITEMGTSWMFCWRFCAVTMISVSAGWLVVVCAQLEPAAMPPEIANTRATPWCKGTRRFVIALPLNCFLNWRGESEPENHCAPHPLVRARGIHRAAHPLWADRHTISHRAYGKGGADTALRASTC